MMNPGLFDYLCATVTTERLDKIERILTERTRHFAVVLENIYHPPNAGAVVRSCECFGIQDVHVIHNAKPFTVNTNVVKGSAQWITMHRYNNGENSSAECIEVLRRQGYKLAVTTLRPDRELLSPEDLPVDNKIALCLGEEENGLSEVMHDHADYFVRIPMYGFTQSFNVSVSAALCLQPMIRKLRQSSIEWHLSDREKQELREEWVCNSVRHVKQLIEHFNSLKR